MSKWVWVIGGGVLQLPMIERARKEGYKVIVSDKDPACPGAKVADSFIELSTYDAPGHELIAESMKAKPSAVLTVGADVGHTVSTVAETLGLPAASYRSAWYCKNKIIMRRTMQKIKAHPIGLEMRFDEPFMHQSWTNYTDKFAVSPYPCVVKPVDNSGSRGVSLVKNRWQLTEALRYAKKYSNRPRISALVEEYVEGPEVAIDFLVEKSRLYLAGAAWRTFGRFGIETGFLTPWDVPKDVMKLCRDVRKALGITWGPLKIDIKCDPRYGWIVMECATRLSGGFDHSHAARMLGKDITGAMLKMALGEPLDKKALKQKEPGYIFVSAPEVPPGRVNGLFFPLWQPDEIFYKAEWSRPVTHNAERSVWFANRGATPFEAYRSAQKSLKEMEVVYG